MGLWQGLGLCYKALQANWPADVAYFKQMGVRNIRPDTDVAARFFIDQGFWVTWGPSTNSPLTATTWPQYRDTVLNTAALWAQSGKALGSFEIGNELEDLIDGTTLSIKQLHQNLRQLAADIKGSYDVGSISYHCWDTWKNNVGTYNEWVETGLGPIDFLGIHVYGHINSGRVEEGGMIHIEKMMKAFGPRCFISEFNLDINASALRSLSPSTATEAMRHFYIDRIVRTLAPYGSRAFVYLWSGVQNADDDFAMKLQNGTMMPQWSAIAGLTSNNSPMVSRAITTHMSSTPQNNQAPKFYCSLIMGGSTSIFLPASPTITALTDFTLMMRIVAGSTITNSGLFRLGFNWTNNKGLLFKVTADRRLQLYQAHPSVSTSPCIPQDTWVHVAVTQIGSRVNFYVNGSMVGTDLTLVPVPQQPVGGAYDMGNDVTSFLGKFSDAKIFNRGLGPLEIASAATGNDAISGVICRLKLDDNGGDVVLDSSGYENHGNIRNGTYSKDVPGSLIDVNI